MFQFHCWSDLYSLPCRDWLSSSGVSIPLLVWFIPSQVPANIPSKWGFNSTVGLIYTLSWWSIWRSEHRFNSTVGLIYTESRTDMIHQPLMFQFHCWSDLYSRLKRISQPRLGFNSTVGLIYTNRNQNTIRHTAAVSIPLLVWFIHIGLGFKDKTANKFQFHCWSDLYMKTWGNEIMADMFQFHCWSDLYPKSKVITPRSLMFQFHCWSDLYRTRPFPSPAICRFNSTVGLIYTRRRMTKSSRKWVSIPLLVWFIQFSSPSCVDDISSFQFHCWSDLYICWCKSFKLFRYVSIPLLVWFIRWLYPYTGLQL